MELVSSLFRKIYAETYIDIVEHQPAFWGYLYALTDREKADSPLRRLRMAIERLNTRKLNQALAEIAPDQVICTHFLPAQLLSRQREKGRFQQPVWVQVTDFDVHALWIQPHLSGYFAASAEVAWRMIERGIPSNAIHVTGIPIMPAFSESLSRTACAAELGLDPSKMTLLMMSGGAGVGGIERLAERLLRLEQDFQLIALAGRNESLLAQLQILTATYPGRLYPMGFTRTIERVMAVADLAITKPGGLTTSECLAVGLPMIVVSPIPGQEERNADYLLENGAALKAYDEGALTYRVNHLLSQPDLLDRLRQNARQLGKPEAARTVLDTVLQSAGVEIRV
jgi:processive 1,2-diacylglycerol beta-glucosyltransferase